MLPLCLIVRHKPPPPKPLPQASDGKTFSDELVVPMSNNSIQYGLSVAIFGCCIAMALPLGHLVSFVTDRGHPIQNAVEVQSIMLLSAFVSRAVLLGLLSDRWGGMRALLIFSIATSDYAYDIHYYS